MLSKSKKIFVADSETDPFAYGATIEPFIWGLYDGETTTLFDTTYEFVQFIKKEKAIVYAHNGGKFDWHFLIEYAEPETDILLINGRIAKLPFGACELRDSMNLFPFALSKYSKEKIDYTKFTKANRNQFMPEIKKYLISDLKNLWNLITPFIEDNGTKLTRAGAAYSIWSKQSKKKAETDKLFDSALRPFYFGGRIQAIKKGYFKQAIYSYDINSAYPYGMMFDHPWGNIAYSSTKLPTDEGELQRAFIHLLAPSIGAFPFRYKHELHFPNDGKEREFWITGWELIESGLLPTQYKLINCVTLAGKVNFSDYVGKFYEMKRAAKERGDINTEIEAKLLLNSLYGKFRKQL